MASECGAFPAGTVSQGACMECGDFVLVACTDHGTQIVGDDAHHACEDRGRNVSVAHAVRPVDQRGYAGCRGCSFIRHEVPRDGVRMCVRRAAWRAGWARR